MNYKEIEKELNRIKNDPKGWENRYSDEDFEDYNVNQDEQYQVNFLGTYMSLDPCGRYHHFLSPNGISKKCERFWENMEKACNELGLWMEEGEGDPCDIFLCKNQ